MRLETFVLRKWLLYKNLGRYYAGYMPGLLIMGYWIFENGCSNFYNVVISPPKPGVPKRIEGQELED